MIFDDNESSIGPIREMLYQIPTYNDRQLNELELERNAMNDLILAEREMDPENITEAELIDDNPYDDREQNDNPYDDNVLVDPNYVPPIGQIISEISKNEEDEINLCGMMINDRSTIILCKKFIKYVIDHKLYDNNNDRTKYLVKSLFVALSQRLFLKYGKTNLHDDKCLSKILKYNRRTQVLIKILQKFSIFLQINFEIANEERKCALLEEKIFKLEKIHDRQQTIEKMQKVKGITNV